MKKCPYCAEEIQEEAIVCRYCGREFESLPTISNLAKPKSARPLWAGIIIGFVIAGLLAARSMGIASQLLTTLPISKQATVGTGILNDIIFTYIVNIVIYSLIGWLVASVLRRVSTKFSTIALALLGTLIVFLLALIFGIVMEYSGIAPNKPGTASNLYPIENQLPTKSPVATPRQPLFTPPSVQTQKPIILPTATPLIPKDCNQPGQVTKKMIHQSICLYGVVGKTTRYHQDKNLGTESNFDVLTLIGPDDRWLALEDTWELKSRMEVGSCWVLLGKVSLLSGCASNDISACYFLRVSGGNPCK